MSKQKESRQTPNAIFKLLMLGLISTAVFALLLTAAALAQERVALLQKEQFPAGMICLAVSALLCGILGSRQKERGGAVGALISESVLFVIITVIQFSAGEDGFGFRYVLNIFCLLFGAFAGTLLTSRRSYRSRRRR